MGLGDIFKSLFGQKEHYDLNSIQGIESIPIKSFEYDPQDGKNYAYHDIEYVLQRKATEHKKNGRVDLAIACLRKSNQIMPLSKMMYTQDDYMRLVKYLRLDKQFEEAARVEKEIQSDKRILDVDSMHQAAYDGQMKLANDLNTDLVEVTCTSYHCAECSAYGNRVYSISGKDKRFPKLPEYVKNNSKHCSMMTYSFVYGINYMTDPYTGKIIKNNDVISYSNRPFADTRPQNWIEGYEHLAEINKQRETDEANSKQAQIEYDQIVINLPDVAPKSQGGYLRMKKSNSANFQKLKEKAVSAGIEIKDLIS